MAGKRTWSDEADAKLQQLRRDGLSWSEVARAFGMSVSAVRGRLDRITGRKKARPSTQAWPRQRRAKLRRAREKAARLPLVMPQRFYEARWDG